MHSLPFLIPMFVVMASSINADDVRRVIAAALVRTGMNQKVAADRAGCSMAQMSRQLTDGSISVKRLLALGPEFMAHLLPLLADLAGVEPQHYTVRERRSA